MSGPFDYINAVSHTKNNFVRDAIDPDLALSGYNKWLTNKTLSYFSDSCLYANEINKYPNLPAIMQYDYYFHSLNKRKRISAKHSKRIISDEVEKISIYFNCNYTKAEEYLLVLTTEQLSEIIKKTEIGG